MKILYVKNNSERAREFQLRTTIYEKNGQKFVVKQALLDEAIPHLKKMKENFQKLSDATIDPRIKLAKIIGESKNSLTFEFIEGISLEKKYKDAQKLSSKKAQLVQDEYFNILKNGFKTLAFDSTTMVTPELKNLFGDINYKNFDGQLCFDSISNIDLIFSNIIFKNDAIYLIDYEWVFDTNIFIDYAAYRALHHDADSWEAIEKHFLDTYVIGEKGFHHTQNNYLQAKPDIVQQIQSHKKHIQELLEHVNGKETHIQELSTKITIDNNEIQNLHKSLKDKNSEIQTLHKRLETKNNEIQTLHKKLETKNNEIQNVGLELTYAREVVDLRDKQLTLKNEQIDFLNTLTIKRRLKHKIKKFIPTKVLTLLGFTAYAPLIMPLQDFSEPITPTINTESPKPLIYTYSEPTLTPTVQDEIQNFANTPLISIVMPVYNVAPKWLDLAIQSIEKQWYSHWELCLADDKSTNTDIIAYLKNINHPKIKVTFLEKNANISGATNAALTLATGKYIALMDNDDEITPDALYEMVKAINHGADFIYSDEDFVSTEGEYSNPHLKPDFSPDLLLSHNYITHFTCFSKTLLDSVGYFNAAFDGAQDYDLFLRLTEQTKNIYHIQKVLYHWRTLETSTSANAEAKPEALERGKHAIEAALKRRNIDAYVENANIHHYFRVRYPIQKTPLVSIIIPFKDMPELLDMSIHSILEKSTYQNYEIIGISNNSAEAETFEMMKLLKEEDKRVNFYEYNVDFNYSDINNHAVNNYAKGEHILLLNNDIEIISPDWLEAMLELSQREDVGCVGAKLYYPNDTIQHAGIIMGLGGYAGHSHKMSPRESYGYFNRLSIIQNLSAVTAACLMIKKSIYDEVAGLDAIHFKVAYNDVDFCLRVREKGYLNLFTPYAEAYHHESISRGYEETPEKIARFQTEKDALYNRHRNILENGDPYYNPALTHDKEDFSVCLNS